MLIRLPYRYTAQIVPPRCRRPRSMEQTAIIALRVREVSNQEAPVAMVERSYERTEEDTWEETRQVYRWFRNRLYVCDRFRRYAHGPLEGQTATQFQADPYPFSLTNDDDRGAQRSQVERRRDFRAWARSLLFVDGERWQMSEEPRYVIMTFGMGHNHGLGWGTELSTETFYNPNIPRHNYFRADEYQAALRAATEIARSRRDTKALPIESTQRPPRFEIFIPEAIRLRQRIRT